MAIIKTNRIADARNAKKLGFQRSFVKELVHVVDFGDNLDGKFMKALEMDNLCFVDCEIVGKATIEIEVFKEKFELSYFYQKGPGPMYCSDYGVIITKMYDMIHGTENKEIAHLNKCVVDFQKLAIKRFRQIVHECCSMYR
jgi:hypothetical protein